MGKEEKTKMDDGEVEKATAPKLRYPWFIIFILGNEFCERFTYYGMKTVLTLYFSKVLFFSEDNTTFYYHFFSMLCYFLPILGAWLADGVIGKFRTILWLSLVYILGLVVLTLAAVPPVHFHAIAGTMSGLLLIAIGTGGIKPCVSTYGADQFKPGQEAHRERFFAYFYFCINAGSLISTFVTPLLRSDVHCFGERTCYSLAFGVPAALMAVALLLFLLGRPFYTDTPVFGSLISRVVFCICHAIANNVRGRKLETSPRPSVSSDSTMIPSDHISHNPLKKARTMWKRKNVVSTTHWLDSAADKYDVEFIADVKQLLKVLLMFVPIPMFWALFDQQGSRWTLQANKMDGRINGYTFQPDQVQIFNPVLILVLIPCFETCFYPVLHKLKIPFRLLARMVVGMVLAGVAFVIAGFLQIAVDKTLPIQPAPGMAELKIFNADSCALLLSGSFMPNGTDYTLPPFEVVDIPALHVQNNSTLTLKVQGIDCPHISGTAEIPINVASGQVYSLFLASREGRLRSRQMDVTKEKPDEANAKVQFILPFAMNSSSGDGNITLINPTVAEGKEGHESVVFVNGTQESDSILVAPSDVGNGPFVVSLSDERAASGNSVTGDKRIDFPNGGVYVVILRNPGDLASSGESWHRFTIVEPSTVSIFWQFPQYFVITVAEVFLSVSGLSFAYSEAPASMRSVMQAAWLLTSAFGSIIVMIVSGGHLIKSQAVEFFVFAGLIGITAIIFAIMCKFYRYLEPADNSMELKKKDDDADSLEKPGSIQTQTSKDPLVRAEADEVQFKK